MIKDSDVEKVLRSWLVEGSDRLPDRVAAAVMERVPATAQRRWPSSLSPRTFASRPWRLAVAAVAILVVSGAAIALLPRGPDRGAITAPSPSVSSSPTSSTQKPAATLRPAGVMDPGIYRMEAPFQAPFSITFPTSWIARSIGGANAEFLKDGSADGEGVWVSAHLVDGVLLDPCHPGTGQVRPTPKTVDEFVAALSALKGFDAGPTSNSSVGGLPAKSLTLTNSIDTDTAGCTEGPMLPLWTFGGGQQAATNGGATEHLRVLIVHRRLVVIDGESFQNTPSNAIEEMQTVIESIVFE